MSIPSPCNKVCIVDPARQLCIGCRRTLDEIGAWSRLGDAEKLEVLRRLDARRPEALGSQASS